MEAKLAEAVGRVNAKLSSIERIRRTATVPAFTVENGMLTPTMKVKRRAVLQHHAARLESLHGKG
jgi:long-chain acyl-CoA synthetase